MKITTYSNSGKIIIINVFFLVPHTSKMSNRKYFYKLISPIITKVELTIVAFSSNFRQTIYIFCPRVQFLAIMIAFHMLIIFFYELKVINLIKYNNNNNTVLAVELLLLRYSIRLRTDVIMSIRIIYQAQN